MVSLPSAHSRPRRRGLPIGLTVTGHYFAIQRFLKTLRSAAVLTGDKIHAKGRLYTVDSIQFTGGTAASTSGQSASPGGSSPPPWPSTRSFTPQQRCPRRRLNDDGAQRPQRRRPDVVGRRLIRQRAGTAYAAAAAAKERRQKIIAAVLGVVIIAVFAYEIPQLLKVIRGQQGSRAVQTTATTPQVVLPSSSARVLKALRHHPPGDPFAQPAPSGADPGPALVACLQVGRSVRAAGYDVVDSVDDRRRRREPAA